MEQVHGEFPDDRFVIWQWIGGLCSKITYGHHVLNTHQEIYVYGLGMMYIFCPVQIPARPFIASSWAYQPKALGLELAQVWLFKGKSFYPLTMHNLLG